MPIYPARRCAFVHVPKTAGSSVTRALARVCGPVEYEDTGIWDVLARSQARETVAVSLRENFRLSTFRDFPQQHLPAAALRALAGEARWSELFRFAFVRNPWDLVVSTYEFNRRHTAQVSQFGIDPDLAELHTRAGSFAQFTEMYPVMRSDMTAMLADNRGNPLVDFVGRYESLAEDFTVICERVGIRAELPRENAVERGDYRSYYDERTRAVVERHFARDIERFGYRF